MRPSQRMPSNAAELHGAFYPDANLMTRRGTLIRVLNNNIIRMFSGLKSDRGRPTLYVGCGTANAQSHHQSSAGLHHTYRHKTRAVSLYHTCTWQVGDTRRILWVTVPLPPSKLACPPRAYSIILTFSRAMYLLQ